MSYAELDSQEEYTWPEFASDEEQAKAKELYGYLAMEVIDRLETLRHNYSDPDKVPDPDWSSYIPEAALIARKWHKTGQAPDVNNRYKRLWPTEEEYTITEERYGDKAETVIEYLRMIRHQPDVAHAVRRRLTGENAWAFREAWNMHLAGRLLEGGDAQESMMKFPAIILLAVLTSLILVVFLAFWSIDAAVMDRIVETILLFSIPATILLWVVVLSLSCLSR